MKITPHRMTLHFALATALLASSAGALAADVYPSKPGRLILPFGAGASTDIIGRIFAQRFSDEWGQQLIVDNRPGAGGIIGTEMAARAAPDGYTLFTYGINQAITPALYSKLPYDARRDFELISLYAKMPNILTVTPSLGPATVAEFVKLAKENPGKFKYASSGIGASPHLTMELFKAVAGIDLVHVPFKNASQGYLDVISGQLQASFFNLPGALSNVRAGRLRALAVSSLKRAEQLPEVPTVIESGVPDFEVAVWQGYAVPRGTPPAFTKKIHAAMMRVLAAPDMQQRLVDNGVAAAPMTPEEFGRFVDVERAKWQKAVALAGAKIE